MSPVEEQQPLRVSVLGVTEKMLNMLQYFFREPGHNYGEIVDDGSAELSIIDLDGVDGRQLLDDHQANFPQQPLIVLSFHDKQIENAILVHKPLKPELLMSALEAVNKELKTRKSSEKVPHRQQPKTRSEVKTSQIVSQPDESAENQLNAESEVEIIAQITGEISAVDTSVIKQVEVIAEATGEILAVEPVESIEAVEQKEAEIPEDVFIQQIEKSNGTEKIPKENIEETPVLQQASMLLDTKDERGYIGSAPDINQDDPEQLRSAQYDPESYFQYHIQQAVLKAVKYHKAVLLTMPHGSLVVLPDANSIFLDIKESRLRAFCALPITDETLTILFMEESDLQVYTQHATLIGLDQLLWKAAIWASRGRIPVDTSLNNPVYFQNWPNISRSLLFPNALRIAALWAERPYSLLDTAVTLQIPQRYVFAFYSASNAIGIAYVRNGSKKDMGKSRPVKKTRERNLLGRFLNRLHDAKRKIHRDRHE